MVKFLLQRPIAVLMAFTACFIVGLVTYFSLRIVEHDGSRVQLKGAIGDDAGVMPALALRIIHHEHMVGELFAKAQLALVLRLLLGRSGAGDLDIQHDKFPSFLITGAAQFLRPKRRMLLSIIIG